MTLGNAGFTDGDSVNWAIKETFLASDSNNFHHFSVGKKCENCTWDKIFPGQNEMILLLELCHGHQGSFPLPLYSLCLCRRTFAFKLLRALVAA